MNAMDPMQMIDAIGRYGLPTVAAGVVLLLFVRMQSRSEARADRLEAKLLGNGDPAKLGKLQELSASLEELQRRNDAAHEQLQARLDEGQQRFAEIDARCEQHREAVP